MREKERGKNIYVPIGAIKRVEKTIAEYRAERLQAQIAEIEAQQMVSQAPTQPAGVA